MVGVAGKSKGCATCRRRKKKCDENKPSCLRCTRSKVACEGYDRYPVFIRRTVNGYEKHTLLEEVRSSSAPLLSLKSPEAEAIRLTSWFVESFASTPPSKFALQDSPHWLHHISSFSIPHPALRASLAAVSLVRWSTVQHRADILMEGCRQYTLSLGLTRKALIDPESVRRDDIVATLCILGLYELADATKSGSARGWLDHLSGLSDLIQYRGPSMHTMPASHAMFEHIRYLFMVKHLLTRKGCVFGQRAWLQDPWRDMNKSLEQQVFDFGLRLAAILERCDILSHVQSSGCDRDQYFEECSAIHDGVRKTHESHIAGAVASDLRPEIEGDTNATLVKDAAGLLLHITALAVQLGASISASVIADSANLSISTNQDPSKPANYTTWEHWKTTIASLQLRHDLAQQIYHACNRCAQQRVGAIGAARMIFALQLAMQQIRSPDQSLEKCQDLIKRLRAQSALFQGLWSGEQQQP